MPACQTHKHAGPYLAYATNSVHSPDFRKGKETKSEDTDKDDESRMKAELEACKLIHDLGERCKAIDADPSIPVRASKKNPECKSSINT